MKVVGRLQILRETDTVLAIDPEIISAARLRPHSMLEAIVLLPPEPPTPQETADAAGSGNGDPISRVTLIATPLPESSWGNLVRMSATLDPRPGSLRKMMEVLNDLHLRCRYVETINDVDLLGRKLFALDLAEYPLGEASTPGATDGEDRKRLSNLIIPSTLVVLELPENHETLELEPETRDVHALLRKLADELTDETGNEQGMARSLLRTLLSRKIDSVEVDWISPMSTLNRLHRRLNPDPEKQGKRWFSRRLSVESAERDLLRLDLLPFRHILWDIGVLPVPPYYRPRASAFVKAFVDSDEKVLCWDFYPLANDPAHFDHLVVQFDLKTPSRGREHLWWHWVYKCVEQAGGNILASASTTRVDGGWTSLQTTVVFPLQEDAAPGGPGDIGKIINCFRKLQGRRGFTLHYKELIGSLEKQPPEDARGLNRDPSKSDEDRHQSLLQNVDVWDSSEQPTSRIRSFLERFAPNPFNFTNPLDLVRYKQLYGDSSLNRDAETPVKSAAASSELLQSRRRLAMRIIQKIAGEPGENIAIVGAHRAGKTTVLNLVHDILERGEPEATGAALTPVRINAALDPPYMFLPAIVRSLQQASLKKEPGKRNAIGKNAAIILDRLTEAASELEIGLEPLLDLPWAISVKGVMALIRSGASQPPATRTEMEAQRLESSDASAILEFLRTSLELLRAALDVKKDPKQLLIIVDEFSESSRWGHEQALPFWRYVIESREFHQIKWLISTSRPIKETSGYSPITNVLHEFNVGPLPHEESEKLLDAFSAHSWSKNPLQVGSASDNEILHPVLMQHARFLLLEITSRLAYLVQVVCYHVYDRATRTYIPLINRNLCIEIVCEYVLPELSDYFEHQWSQVREEDRKRLLAFLPSNTSQKEFLRNLDSWTENVQDLPQGLRKSLERLGLRGDDSHIVAPLVACWLLPAS